MWKVSINQCSIIVHHNETVKTKIMRYLDSLSLSQLMIINGVTLKGSPRPCDFHVLFNLGMAVVVADHPPPLSCTNQPFPSCTRLMQLPSSLELFFKHRERESEREQCVLQSFPSSIAKYSPDALSNISTVNRLLKDDGRRDIKVLDRFDWTRAVVVVIFSYRGPCEYCCLLYLLNFQCLAYPALPSPTTVLPIHSPARPGLREREHLTVSASNVTAKYCNSSKYQDRSGGSK